ncbi:MAG: 50S ribosomal protein L1 [SAR324 cluster bacterium]|uniref:Large ribosomal subunit protein uL1 n=1 Tax=SAR324 cluster bacterium TaxID=2024889 RepID=A0A2A4T837_9DELT|nr:MAG: 50S ribosomal protein L1 [SAR324 cluster bacterium]
MAKLSKKAKEWSKKIDSTKRYELTEAIKLVQEFSSAKFEERVDVSFRLGIDPRKSDQMVRGSCSLPNGTGKEVRVLVFARGEKEKEALEAGADFAGSDELVAKIQSGWLEFDRVVATPDMMAVVGRIGRVLGPRGLMPNPKVGTVTQNVGEIVKTIKQGQVQFRTDKGANVQTTVGLVSFSSEKLAENIQSFYESLVKLKPATAKGIYIKNISISSTMGPGVKIDISNFK